MGARKCEPKRAPSWQAVMTGMGGKWSLAPRDAVGLERGATRSNGRGFDPHDSHGEQDQTLVVCDRQFEVAIIPKMLRRIRQQLARELHRLALGLMDGRELKALVILRIPRGRMVRMKIEARHGVALSRGGLDGPYNRLGRR